MSIRLHSEKGVNPRLTICRNCGKDVGIALLGADDKKWRCKGCGRIHIGRMPNKCPCGVVREGYRAYHPRDNFEQIGTVEEYEKLPIELCDECLKREEECSAEVKLGGVYWRCSDCGSSGALKAGAELAKMVREKSGIKPPGPVGIAFTKAEGCPVCSEEAQHEAPA